MQTYSIRCRRDKRRKVVDARWLEICDWLCPKCYYKLTEEERKRFSPPIDKVKPRLVETLSTKESAELAVYRELMAAHQITISDSPEAQITAEPPAFTESVVTTEAEPIIPQQRDGKPKRRKWGSGKKHNLRFSKVIDDVKPKHTIDCKKCGKTVPCFALWYDQSKVLCPACYHSMSEKQRRDFEIAYKVQNGGFLSEFNSPRWNRRTSDSLACAVGVSEDFIHRAPKRDLEYAVAHGKLSAVRMRIELKRRQRPDYYADFADVAESVNMRGKLSLKGF